MNQELFDWTYNQLNKHKEFFGLGAYEISVMDKTGLANDYVAEAVCDIYGQTIKFIFYERYLLDEKDRFETIIHELIHARLGIMGDKIEVLYESIHYQEEEYAVNDITRGFVKLLKVVEEKK